MIADPTKTPACPFCSSSMQAVYVITNGGVWFCESKEYLDYVVAGRPSEESERMMRLNREAPMHCVVGSSGYTKGYGKWPKSALYCVQCGAITIDCKDRRSTEQP
jgi:hypothetical protein